MKTKFLDDVIFRALRKNNKVELFLCKDKIGGFGIKIDGKRIFRNLPWETLEYTIEDKKEIKFYNKFMEHETVLR